MVMSKRKDTSAEKVKTLLPSKPKGLPPRDALVQAMLEGTTRKAVPIRTVFVQRKVAGVDGTRGSVLAAIVKTRSAYFLDAFLLIHALASSSEPYNAVYPAQTWVRALGMDEKSGDGNVQGLGVAKSSWSKVLRRLEDLQLITRKRTDGMMGYQLLDESGTGAPYIRPTNIEHGSWFNVPHIYWTEGHYIELSLSAKAMLLIALSLDEDFPLPSERAPSWYGISPATAKRGLRELVQKEFLAYSTGWRVDPKSKTGWAEVRSYNLLGEWSLASRKAQSKRPPKVAVTAAAPEEVLVTDEKPTTAATGEELATS